MQNPPRLTPLCSPARADSIVYAKQGDKAKGTAIKAYVKYLVTDGQKPAAETPFRDFEIQPAAVVVK